MIKKKEKTAKLSKNSNFIKGVQNKPYFKQLFIFIFAIVIMGTYVIASTVISDTGINSPLGTYTNISSVKAFFGSSSSNIQTDGQYGQVQINSNNNDSHTLYINSTNGKRGLYVGINDVIDSTAGIAGFYVYTGVKQTGANPLALIEQDNADSTSRNLLLHNDGQGENLRLNSNGNGTGMVIFKGIKPLGADKSMMTIYNDQIETISRNLVEFKIDNSASTINLLEIENDGSGKGIFLDQNGEGIGIEIDSESTTFAPLILRSNNPPCNVNNEGGIYYNSTTNKHYGCNSTTWNALY
jgi:hypothetical protein